MSNGFGCGGKKSKKLSSKNEPKSSYKNQHIDNHTWHHNDDSFWYKRGLLLVDSKKYKEAIIAFEHAVLCNPQNCQAWNNKGNCLYELNRYEDAITAYEKAIEIDHNIAGFWANKDCSLARLDKHQQAILAYHNAISIPSFPDKKHDYWNNIGVAYTNLGDYKKAIEAYDHATSIKPNYYEAWFSKSTALYKLGRYEESLKACDKVIEFDKNNYKALDNKGIALAKLGRYEESLNAYEQAIKIQPYYHNAWYNKGVHFYRFEDYKDAIVAFDKVISLKPSYLNQAWHGKGHCLEALKHYEEAINAYDQAIQLCPNHNSWNGKGICLAELEKYDEAIEAYNKSLKINPQDWMVWINLGTATSFQSGYQEQIACIEKGLQNVSQETDLEGWGQLHRAIGNANYFHGRKQEDPSFFWRKAISSYETALEILTATPQFEDVYLVTLQDLIRALLGLSETGKAESHLQQGTDFLDARLLEKSGEDRERFEEQFRKRFNELTVDLYVQQDRLVEALKVAEKDKNAFLFYTLFAKTNELSPDYSQMCAFLNQKPNAAIIYWQLSDNALTTFILAPNNSSEIILTLPAEHISENGAIAQRNQFREWITIWNKDYDDYGSKKTKFEPKEIKLEPKDGNHPWRFQMEERLNKLKTILRIADIETSLADFTQCTQLILILRHDLLRLPLDSLFAEKYTISYLPSIQVGMNLFHKPKLNCNQLLSIENPDSKDFQPLTAAEGESEIICRMYDKPTRRAKTETSLSEVTTQLKAPQHTVLHFTGHSFHDFANPSNSALFLSGSDRLSLTDIASFNLNNYQIACLSGCETAINSNQNLAKGYLSRLQYKNVDGDDNLSNSLLKAEVEDVSITSAFMYSGVANVVSTLWTVESISSALLMIEFHRYYLAGNSAATALAKAKNWLRNATSTDLQDWYVKRIEELPDMHSLKSLLRRQRNKLSIMEPQPFKHPYYWAAFTISGL